MTKPTKDDVIKDVLEFFFEEFENAPTEIGAWLAQGDWDTDEFITAARKLQTELKLRD